MNDGAPPPPPVELPPMPPPPEPGWRHTLSRVPTWALISIPLGLAAIIAAIVLSGGGTQTGEMDPSVDVAGSSTLPSATTTEPDGSAAAETTATTLADGASTGDDDPSDTSDPGGESGTTETTEPGEDPGGEPGEEPLPFEWPSPISVRFDVHPGWMDAYFTWLNPDGETHYTYQYSYEGDGGDGGDFGDLLQDYVHYENEAACNGQVSLTLIAWDGDTELGRLDISASSPDCPAEPPTGMNVEWSREGVLVYWTPGAGYSHYAYEVSTDNAGSSGVPAGADAGTLPRVTDDFFIPLGCGMDFSFDLTPVLDNGEVLDALHYGGRSTSCPRFYITEGAIVDVPAGAGLGSTATCGANSAITGGYRIWPEAAAMPYPGWLYFNGPAGTGWGAYLLAPPERSLKVQAYALCSMGGSLQATTSTATTPVPAGSVRSLVASCPAGRSIAGGGFNTAPGANVLVSKRDGNGWRVTVFNELSSDAELDVYASCIEDPYGRVVPSDSTNVVSVADGEYGPGTNLSCPAGTVLIGGGFSSPDAFFVSSYPAGSGDRLDWLVEGFNRAFEVGPPGAAVVVEASAVCLEFPLRWRDP